MHPIMRILLSFVFIIKLSLADPAEELNQCLETGEKGNEECLKIVIFSLKNYMKNGIPEAGLAPLDPLQLDNVEFNLGGANIEFQNITMTGLSEHRVQKVEFNENTRSLSMTLEVSKLRSRGHYSLTGKVLNVEGLDSNGPYRNEYSDIKAIGEGTIVPKGSGIEIGQMKIRLQIGNINVHMECLFPRRTKNCCDKDKEFRSCNPILSKTIHRCRKVSCNKLY